MCYVSTKVIELGSCAFRQWRADHSHCHYLHGYQLKAKYWFGCKELDNKNWAVDFGGLKDLKEGLIGPGYGYQWRFFNSPYNKQSGEPFSEINGIDQLQLIIDQLKDPEKRTSRRLIMTAWNPCQLDQMALPPCHVLCQFNVHDGNKLSCTMYQRSVDTMLGLPFNIASYAILLHLLAKEVNMIPGDLIFNGGDCHIYSNQIEGVKEQLERKTYNLPKIKLNNKSIFDLEYQDIEIVGYESSPTIQFPLSN